MATLLTVHLADVTYDFLNETASRVLDLSARQPDWLADELVNITSEALARTVTPELSQFDLSPPAIGLAHLLYRSRSHRNPIVYETVRSAVASAEADRLLAEAYEAVWPHLVSVYASNVATFASDRTDYQIVAIEQLPVPHNLSRGCPAAERLEQLITDAQNPTILRRLRRNVPTDERSAWATFQRELANGATSPCGLHELADAQMWVSAVNLAVNLWQNSPTWKRSAVYSWMLTTTHSTEPLLPRERLAWSLLADPIVWPKGSTQLDNGQHRLCGAALADAKDLLVLRR